MKIEEVANFVHDILSDIGIPLLSSPEKFASQIDRVNLGFAPSIFIIARFDTFYLGIDLLKKDSLRLPKDPQRYNEEFVVNLIQSWVKFVLEEFNNPQCLKK